MGYHITWDVLHTNHKPHDFKHIHFRCSLCTQAVCLLILGKLPILHMHEEVISGQTYPHCTHAKHLSKQVFFV